MGNPPDENRQRFHAIPQQDACQSEQRLTGSGGVVQVLDEKDP